MKRKGNLPYLLTSNIVGLNLQMNVKFVQNESLCEFAFYCFAAQVDSKR